MSTKRFQFDPTAVAAAGRKAKQDRLDALDEKIYSRAGTLLERIKAAYEATQADEDAPLDVQIKDGEKLLETLEAMLAAQAGTASSTPQLTNKEQRVLDLVRQGTVDFVNTVIDDPANVGQRITIELVRDKRWPNHRKTSTSAQSAPVATSQSGTASQSPSAAAPQTPPVATPQTGTAGTAQTGTAPQSATTTQPPSGASPQTAPTALPPARPRPTKDNPFGGLSGIFTRRQN